MKVFLSLLAIIICTNVYAIKKVKTHPLVYQSTTTESGLAILPTGDKKTFQATGYVATGTGAATIGVNVSNDGTNFIEVDELSLTLGTAVVSDYYINNDPWKYIKGIVKTITGSVAQVSLTVGTDQ